MNSQNKQVDETLRSLDHLNRAEANPQLYEMVMQRLKVQETKVTDFRYGIFWRAAACITIFTVLNIFTMFYRHKQHANPDMEKNAFGTEYFSYINEI